MVPSPTSSGESWCHPSVPTPNVTIQVLMPNGLIHSLSVNRDTSLEILKTKLWIESKNTILFRLLNENQSLYVFKGITMDSKSVEFYDESRKMADLKLFLPILNLILINSGQDCNLTDDKITSSYISVTIGPNCTSMAAFDASESIDPEFADARKSFLLLSQSVVNERSRFDDYKKLKYHFPTILEATHDMVTSGHCSNVSKNSGSPTKEQFHDFTILVPELSADTNVSSAGHPLKSFELKLNLSQTPKEVIAFVKSLKFEHLAPKNSNFEFILKVIGSNEYLLEDVPLSKFQYISKSVSQKRKCYLVMIAQSQLLESIPEESFQVPTFLRRQSGKSTSGIDKSTMSTESLQYQLNRDLELGHAHSLWKTDSSFQVYVNVATYANVKDFDSVFVVLGLYHGTEPLCDVVRTKLATPQNPKWQETITFNISLEDVPRGARLCVSMCSKQTPTSIKSSGKGTKVPESVSPSNGPQMDKDMTGSVPIAYGNIAVFDYKERLLSGKVLLSLWRLPKEHWSDLLYPLGVTGPNPDKDALALDISFPEFNCPIIFPPDVHVKCFADHLIQLAVKGRSPGHARVNAARRGSLDPPTLEEKSTVDALTKLDPLAVMTPSEKDLMWSLRNHCAKEVPDSLPKLLDSIKWNDREEVAELYLLLSNWRPVTIVTALELLDCKYTDPKVRSFAISSLEVSLPDHLLSEYLLQLVQVALHEPYLDNDVSRFLLKRSLLVSRIGHLFFWMIKSECHDPINGKACALLLESFLRGVPRQSLRNLMKQVESLDKLTTITNILKEKKQADVKERVVLLKEYLKQDDFVSVLNNVSSPLVPNEILGQLLIDECRIMDSAKRPLWLVWSNGDPIVSTLLKDRAQNETFLRKNLNCDISIIFKNGDDLRQDMLTLQVIKIMDSIWRSEGIDLKMSPYTCRSTGHMTGLIQVVKDARTVMAIQKSLSVLAGFQIGSRELYKWFERGDDGAKVTDARFERLMENFTHSCAGYCVATFVLGIGDRNPDNIMINDDGQIFHIDFGHFLGHFKKKFGINRERVPFVLTDDFLFVICRGKEPSPNNENLRKFNELCEKAYLVLRRHANLFITLFTLMLSTGIPELQSPDDVAFLRSKLQVDAKRSGMTEEEDEQSALRYFRNQLQEARAGSTYTKLDWFFHAVHHARTK